jgi:hypothetical protein
MIAGGQDSREPVRRVFETSGSNSIRICLVMAEHQLNEVKGLLLQFQAPIWDEVAQTLLEAIREGGNVAEQRLLHQIRLVSENPLFCLVITG